MSTHQATCQMEQKQQIMLIINLPDTFGCMFKFSQLYKTKSVSLLNKHIDGPTL